MSNLPEIYVSTDVETDGPIPGIHSMLSFGSAAYLADKTLLDTFTANLETLPGATAHPKTIEWWKSQPEAWKACRENPQAPEKVMQDYLTWLKGLPGIPVFVGYPAAYDFMFVYWYLIRFTGESPFSHSALDIKTFAMALMKTPYRQSTKKNMPRSWFDKLPHTHRALEDAIEQGALFCNMLAESINREGITPFDESIIKFNKRGSDPKSMLMSSFLREIKIIYLLMREVSQSIKAQSEIFTSFSTLLMSKVHLEQLGTMGNKIKLMSVDLTVQTRLLYNTLASTLVSYGEKDEAIRKKIPTYYRIKMFRNTISAHWKEYLDLPRNGFYLDFSKDFAVPDYMKSDFSTTEVNNIFKEYDLKISLGDDWTLITNKPEAFEKIYQSLEEKWGKSLATKKNELGKLIEEINDHFLIVPITDLKKFFTDLAEAFKKEFERT